MRVYIASPYEGARRWSKVPLIGWWIKRKRVLHSLDVADDLFAMGLTPLPPLLSHFWAKYGRARKRKWDQWLAYDVALLAGSAEAVLRLPGVSRGADYEVAVAEAAGIPVFHDLERLVGYAAEQAQSY